MKRWGQHNLILLVLVCVFCLFLFFICLLMQVYYYYRPFHHRIMIRYTHLHGQTAFITFVVCLCIGFLYCCLMLARFVLFEHKGFPFTPNKTHSHIVATHSNLCVGNGDRSMSRFHTWHQFKESIKPSTTNISSLFQFLFCSRSLLLSQCLKY